MTNANAKVTHYHNGIIRIDGRPGDYLVEQTHWTTRVYRLATDRKSRTEIAMPRARYALSQPADCLVFDADLIAALDG
ncbi:MAG: hypothetical protein IT519_16790 [Burkholderiales bacterium]|nr:hypothetical protein [Burkholderiales bacterium]